MDCPFDVAVTILVEDVIYSCSCCAYEGGNSGVLAQYVRVQDQHHRSVSLCINVLHAVLPQ
jgi:hypothetical protein